MNILNRSAVAIASLVLLLANINSAYAGIDVIEAK